MLEKEVPQLLVAVPSFLTVQVTGELDEFLQEASEGVKLCSLIVQVTESSASVQLILPLGELKARSGGGELLTRAGRGARGGRFRWGLARLLGLLALLAVPRRVIVGGGVIAAVTVVGQDEPHDQSDDGDDGDGPEDPQPQGRAGSGLLLGLLADAE